VVILLLGTCFSQLEGLKNPRAPEQEFAPFACSFAGIWVIGGADLSAQPRSDVINVGGTSNNKEPDLPLVLVPLTRLEGAHDLARGFFLLNNGASLLQFADFLKLRFQSRGEMAGCEIPHAVFARNDEASQKIRVEALGI
jgi:hypothetical protein